MLIIYFAAFLVTCKGVFCCQCPNWICTLATQNEMQNNLAGSPYYWYGQRAQNLLNVYLKVSILLQLLFYGSLSSDSMKPASNSNRVDDGLSSRQKA